MRAIDAKILEELDMHYDDKDCFASLDSWLEHAKTYMINLNRLFVVADHTKQQHPSESNAITDYRKRIIKLFNQSSKDWHKNLLITGLLFVIYLIIIWILLPAIGINLE
ncbi:MAG: hypothetical protein P8X84_06570 [Candidatus Bathyarchaeota archaeon]